MQKIYRVFNPITGNYVTVDSYESAVEMIMKYITDELTMKYPIQKKFSEAT